MGSAYLNLRELLCRDAEARQHELRFVAADGGVLGAISASISALPCLAALAALPAQPGVPGGVVAGGGAAAAGAEPSVAPHGEEAAAVASGGADAGRRAVQGEASGGSSEAVEVGCGTSAVGRSVSAAGLLTSGVLPQRRGLLPPLQPRPWAVAEPASQAGGASESSSGLGCGPVAAAAAPAAAAAAPAATSSTAAVATRSLRSLFRVPSSELRVQVAPAPVPPQGLSPLPGSPAAGAAGAAKPKVATERGSANSDAAARSVVHRALAGDLEASCAWHSKATAGRRDSRERRSSHGQVLPLEASRNA